MKRSVERSPQRSGRLDLPLILPGVGDLDDACVIRLVRLLEKLDGIMRVHIVRPGRGTSNSVADAATARGSDSLSDSLYVADETATIQHSASKLDSEPATEPQLCLHYDPERVTLAQVAKLAKAAGASISKRFAHAVIPFHAITSEDGGRYLESALRGIPGVTAATVNLAGQVARVEYDRRRVDLATIREQLAEAGARADELPPQTIDQNDQDDRDGYDQESSIGADDDEYRDDQAAADDTANAGWYTRNRELAWSFIAGALLLLGWVASRTIGRTGSSLACLPLALYAASYVFGARDNVGHFVRDLRRGHFHFDIDLLMVVAAAGAAILGQWVEGALLLFLFSLGHALEHYALGRARNAIKALAELAPARATVLREVDGIRRETEVPIEEVRPGDLAVVKPAERIPVDGTVREGKSTVNQAPITGESMPVGKAPGDNVYAGSVNGEGAIVVEVTSAVGDRTLDRVIKLVAEAQTQKAPTQQFTDRFEHYFVPAVLVADVLLIALPPLLGVWSWGDSFYRAMALLVAASPCALALGTPAAVLAGIAQAARNGVLIKGGAHLETLGTINMLALDKTGTITKGEPAVTDLVPAAGVSEGDLLAIAAAVERRSQHPLARAILTAADERRLDVPEAGDVEAVTGKGIRSMVDGRVVEIGRLLMFGEAGRTVADNAGGAAAAVPDALRESVARLEAAGRTTMVVRHAPNRSSPAHPETGAQTAEGWIGVIGIADEPRAGVRRTLDRLRATGIKRIVMLTGDNAGVGAAIGNDVGVDEVRANLLPEDKVTAIKELTTNGLVAMVGDGVNDAPALAHATIGIAMGGAGTAAALETADVALMGDDLGHLVFAVGLSRQARRVIKQNLFIALGVIAVLVVATVTGTVGIGPAVVVHEGSTLVVIANALRLLMYKERSDENDDRSRDDSRLRKAA